MSELDREWWAEYLRAAEQGRRRGPTADDAALAYKRQRDALLADLEKHHREDRQCSVYLSDRDPAFCPTCTLMDRVNKESQ